MTDTGGVAAFAGLVDLLAEDLGGHALLTSDDWFASKDNLVKPGRGVFDPNAYTDTGKLMDGWESRRRRSPGHDWCILKLGVPGVIEGVDIDTNHFLGNHAPYATLDAACVPEGTTEASLRDHVDWTPIVGQVPLRRGSQNLFAVADRRTWTHVRLSMLPDGGIARLRLWGKPTVTEDSTGRHDLAAAIHGGRAIAASDMFFAPMHQLLLPGRPTHMGGGWETRRSRPPGQDWIIVALGQPGMLDEVDLDTLHYKGNYPSHAAVDALCWPDAPVWELTRSRAWVEILGWQPLRGHDHNRFALSGGPYTHVRLRIRPDGGIARMRIFGEPTRAGSGDDPLLDRLAALDDEDATRTFLSCCGSQMWARQMSQARPFVSRAHLHGVAAQLWWRLGDGAWLEAFSAHPRIGADVASLRAKYGAGSFSEREQAGMAGAGDDVLAELAAANQAYETEYGFLFLVCATGKSPSQMLEILRGRLGNRAEDEIRIAAAEQDKITHLRLDSLEGAS